MNDKNNLRDILKKTIIEIDTKAHENLSAFKIINQILKVEKLKNNLSNKKKEYIKNLILYFTAKPDRDIISYCYWELKLPITNELIKAMKIKPAEFYKKYIIPNKKICSYCDREHYVQSKSASLSCDCWKEENEKHYQQMQQNAQQRAERLLALKSMPYKDYLETSEWQERRRYYYRSVGGRCQLCNGGGEIHIHHRTYENIGEENYKDLIALCKSCHQKFHNRP